MTITVHANHAKILCSVISYIGFSILVLKFLIITQCQQATSGEYGRATSFVVVSLWKIYFLLLKKGGVRTPLQVVFLEKGGSGPLGPPRCIRPWFSLLYYTLYVNVVVYI